MSMLQDLILNPVTLSVIVMVTLCLLKFNIILSVLIATLFAGLISGVTGHNVMPLSATVGEYIETGVPGVMQAFIGMPANPAIVNAGLVPPSGMAGMNNIALAYILLGALAYALQASGLATKFANLLERVFGRTGKIFLLVLAVVSSFSQNLIPIHIALIPILVPPLLSMMNKLKIDRRAAACSIAFGLKAPYILLPFGFGLIFQNIVITQISANGLDITDRAIWPYMIPLAGAMVLGLFVAIFISYRKPREYEDKPLLVAAEVDEDDIKGKFKLKHWGALLGACATFGVQVWANWAFEGSPLWALSLGATLALIIMFFFGTLNPRRMQLNESIKGGIGLMGFIAFIMLVAAGYASVLQATGGIRTLVDAALYLAGDNHIFALIAMQVIGLLITMGIGTSFGTIPLIAAVFVPFLLGMGASPAAIIVTIAAAGVTGDAGMPQSDTALGPTAGLDADGQHDHIKDTCFPTFLHFNIPIKVVGVIAAAFMWSWGA
ncbi:MAG: sodium:proton antiporter [Oscillospiraceae bacterium]|nr:sodium:proton antiporter [Oscillospiraceae bacterium]